MKQYKTTRKNVRISGDGRIGFRFNEPEYLVQIASKFMNEFTIPHTKDKLSTSSGRDRHYGSTSNAGVAAEVAWLMIKDDSLTEQDACQQWYEKTMARPFARLDDDELKVELKNTLNYENYNNFFPNLFASHSKMEQLKQSKDILWCYCQGFVTNRRATEKLGINRHGHAVYPMDIMTDPSMEIGKPCWVVFNDWLNSDSMLPSPFKWQDYVVRTGTSDSVKFRHDGREGQWDLTDKAVNAPIMRELLGLTYEEGN